MIPGLELIKMSDPAFDFEAVLLTDSSRFSIRRMSETPLLEVRNLSKSFPGVRALSQVDLKLGHGEVLALIGENGAGKSTLMKILAGVQAQDEGDILLNGEVVRFNNVEQSLQQGIALIHQELNLSDNLDVGANIFLGREPGFAVCHQQKQNSTRSDAFFGHGWT